MNILHEILEKFYTIRREYLVKSYPLPNIKLELSPKGHNDLMNCKDIKHFIRLDNNSILGLKYEVVYKQTELYKIVVYKRKYRDYNYIVK